MDGAIFQQETNQKLRLVYDYLLRADPTNTDLKHQSEKLGVDKNRYCEKIVKQWEQRVQPIHTEYSIRELNSAYLASIDAHQASDILTNRTTSSLGQRDWVIKNSSNWVGYSLEDGSYLQQKILFQGKLNFEESYAALCVTEPESQSCNLLWSLQRLIKAGSDNCLSNEAWVCLFLNFCKKHMPSSYTTLSRYSDDADRLVRQLISHVNPDLEVNRCRATMSKLCRRPGEPLQLVLYRLKSIWELCLSIIWPNLSEQTAQIRSDAYACASAKFFVTPATLQQIEQYTIRTQQAGDQITVHKICQLAMLFEAQNKDKMITETRYLPESATRMEQNPSMASNVEQLQITKAFVRQGRSRTPRRNSKNGSKNFVSRSRSTSKNSGGSDNYRKVKRFTSPNTNRVFKKTNNKNYYSARSNSRGNYSRANSASSRDRYKSPDSGKKYYRSRSGNHYRPRSYSNGRSGSRNGTRQNKVKCLRCHSTNHSSGNCPTYSYYKGPPCNICGALHETGKHKNRRFSKSRSPSASRQKPVRQNAVEIAPAPQPQTQTGISMADVVEVFRKNPTLQN